MSLKVQYYRPEAALSAPTPSPLPPPPPEPIAPAPISQMMFVFGEVQDPAPRPPHILIRHDRAKVNRLRTYLSWKEVRKHAKDSGGDGGAPEVDLPEDAADDKLTQKAQKIRIKLPWEDEEEDEDDIEAHEASIQRLKEADDATRQMTREEYQHYSDCRQASFTYRKGILEPPSSPRPQAADDTVDIVGFLAFEMVRSLTLAGLESRNLWKSLICGRIRELVMVLGKRKNTGGLAGDAKRLRRETTPEEDSPLPQSSLFVPPSEARTSLRPEHIQDAFARMQSDWTQRRSAGMRNWRGGLIRTTVSLI
ncbi:hypothetical protein BC629DRAFT_1714848 [Irpex lacteus]|nr:hypothetical protein BC629DRAFT_1714848 [Irpex lacteus]